MWSMRNRMAGAAMVVALAVAGWLPSGTAQAAAVQTVPAALSLLGDARVANGDVVDVHYRRYRHRHYRRHYRPRYRHRIRRHHHRHCHYYRHRVRCHRHRHRRGHHG